MRAPRRRPSDAPPERDDLEGYFVGVARRVEERRAEAPLEPAVDTELKAARAALDAGRLAEADERLRALDGLLDARTPEMEMLDRPRGLVGYVPLGDRGVPPESEEEPLANRIRLVGRLASLRASEGTDVREARRELARAQAAYDAGDRPAARAAVDRAHRWLDEGTAGAGTV